MKRAFVVSILNQKLTLKSDSDDQYLSEVAGFVSRRIEEVMEKSRTVSSLTVALLTCLNIADELFHSRRMREIMTEKATAKIQEMIKMIELTKQEGQQVL